MILNAAAGSIDTGAGVAPAASSQRSSASSAADPSSEMRLAEHAMPSNEAALAASANTNFAPQSDSIICMLSGRDDVGSGATATPARSAPRNTAPYSMLPAAQIAIT